jgi:hypothetical protein
MDDVCLAHLGLSDREGLSFRSKNPPRLALPRTMPAKNAGRRPANHMLVKLLAVHAAKRENRPVDPCGKKMSSKKLKSKQSGGICLACNGSGVIVIEDPAFSERRQPPVCPRCRGSGRLEEGRSIVADVWEGFKSTNSGNDSVSRSPGFSLEPKGIEIIDQQLGAEIIGNPSRKAEADRASVKAPPTGRAGRCQHGERCISSRPRGAMSPTGGPTE